MAGPDRLKALVDAAHNKGIAVFLDVVFNHIGPEGNYLPRFGPYFTNQYVTPWGNAINLMESGLMVCGNIFVTRYCTGMRIITSMDFASMPSI